VGHRRDALRQNRNQHQPRRPPGRSSGVRGRASGCAARWAFRGDRAEQPGARRRLDPAHARPRLGEDTAPADPPAWAVAERIRDPRCRTRSSSAAALTAWRRRSRSLSRRRLHAIGAGDRASPSRQTCGRGAPEARITHERADGVNSSTPWRSGSPARCLRNVELLVHERAGGGIVGLAGTEERNGIGRDEVPWHVELAHPFGSRPLSRSRRSGCLRSVSRTSP
jgi:hypothetical protein